MSKNAGVGGNSTSRRIDRALNRNAGVLRLLAGVVASVGFVLSILQWRSHEKERRSEVSRSVYLEIDKNYAELTARCGEHPEFDCFDSPLSVAQVAELDGGALSLRERMQQRALYIEIITMCEKAFILFSDDSDLFNNQVCGWREYERSLLLRPAFAEVWRDIRCGYHEVFMSEMDELSGGSFEKCKGHSEQGAGRDALKDRRDRCK